MKRIKIYTVVSMDGFIARSDGDIDWMTDWVMEHSEPDGNDYGFHEFSRTVDRVILNQSYYHQLRTYDVCWPPEGIQCYLFTDPAYPLPNSENIRLLPYMADDPSTSEIIAELLDKGEDDIWVAGDHELIALFAEANLIDEMVLNILPVTLGEGIRFPFGSKENHWRTDDTKKYSSGVVQIKYHADRS